MTRTKEFPPQVENESLLVESHSEVLCGMVYEVLKKLNSSVIEYDDAMSDAYIALLKIIRTQRQDGASITTRLKHRVYGCIIDGLRIRGPVNRAGKPRVHTKFLSINDKGFREHKSKIKRKPSSPSSSERMEQEEQIEHIARGLSKRYIRVLKLYFIDSYTLNQIAKLEGVSESRIHHIIHESLDFIKERMKKEDHD